VVGDTYTVLLSGEDTGGRFTLIEMYVPPGGGPLPHRHDFEETFIISEGQLDISFSGATSPARPGPRSTCPPTPHTSSATPPQNQRACCASARHQARSSSSPPSATESQTAPRRLPALTPRPGGPHGKSPATGPAYRTELLQP